MQTAGAYDSVQIFICGQHIIKPFIVSSIIVFLRRIWYN